MSELEQQIAKRRTFAIISHPDAGKTTLTEKLLLYSGMLRTAGIVSGRKGAKAAASDWMSMEQERGISITASAMQFTYRDCVINVLDTPGHQDFSEDTYRTLTAADCVIMVIDSSKGIEAQTLKLFDACRLRGIPVITFINKMDLEGLDPIELMEEVETTLGIQASAINWPIGCGRRFLGVVDRADHKVHFFTKTSSGGATLPDVENLQLSDVTPREGLTDDDIEDLQLEIELLDEAGNKFDHQAFLDFKVTPVFFGSAFTNFGIQLLFDALIDLAPAPTARQAFKGEEEIHIETTDNFSAYVFKLQANMDPRHRDCIAFMRINSGAYERDMQVINERTGKKIRLSRPHTLMVSERNTLELAYPGDVIGVVNPGHFSIGDTISIKGNFAYRGLPQFQPEVFTRISPIDLGKRKAIDKGINQLAAEGAVQVLRDINNKFSAPMMAAVGRLQFEVMQHRLKEEYNVETKLEPMPYQASAWIIGDIKTFKMPFSAKLVQDYKERPMVVFTSPWEKDYARKENPDHQLLDYA